MAEPSQQTLDRAVRGYVAQSTGLSPTLVIPGNDNHASPVTPYASVLEIATVQSGIDAEITRTNDADPEVADAVNIGRRFATYSIQFYKSGAADYVRSLISYHSTTPGQIYLTENALTVMSLSDIRNLDTTIGSKYEQRRSIDVTFAYRSRTEYELANIASIDIDITLSAEADITATIEEAEDA